MDMSPDDVACVGTPGFVLGYPGDNDVDIQVCRDDILQFLNGEEIGATVVQLGIM